ncbi:MAG: quinate 5-dehydrogenase [Succiniclasticum sp.]|nr:quinate 5-dehydrogenase [Succiniclasticum sp.]MEE3479042.1 quinate 5-dehydrogenase [Succiniclasticum sp.]
MENRKDNGNRTRKRVISISLGSSERDAAGTLELGDTVIRLERRGTDGDMDKAAALLRAYNGKVDAIGLGGTDLYLVAGRHRYVFRESARLLENVKQTPVLDGSGLKNTLERSIVRRLAADGTVDFRGKKVLLTCAVDRFGMAEALCEAGADVTFGDILYGLGFPVPLHSLSLLDKLAALVVPVITKMPIRWFYPTGKEQTRRVVRYPEYFLRNDIIAGDFLFIKRFMPNRLDGKTILTNTVTAKDRVMLREAGVRTLITTTPRVNGRSFGTNVMEAALVASVGARHSLEPAAYDELIRKYHLHASVETLNGPRQEA